MWDCVHVSCASPVLQPEKNHSEINDSNLTENNALI